MPIDPNRVFTSVNIAILTVLDTRDPATDRSGDLLAGKVAAAGHRTITRNIVCDEANAIEIILREWIKDVDIDVIVSTGGTGLTGRDVTPEAFARILEKEIPGFGELFRILSYAKIGSSTIQSRAVGGVSEGKYLFALPGSPGAVSDAWEVILVHQLDNRHQPCNLVDLMPRLREQRLSSSFVEVSAIALSPYESTNEEDQR